MLTPANDRTYGYLDHQYFLIQGDGPWGTRAWTYDPVGNRLTEDRDGVAMDVYSYVPNAAMGHSPKLDQINQTAIGVISSFEYDAAGNQIEVTEGVEVTTFAYDNASRLSRIERLNEDAASDLVYDGRSFLRRAEASSISVLFESGFESGGTACWTATVPGPPTGTCPPKPITGPTYSSDGVLHHVAKSDSTEQRVIVYLAGRPVAIVSVNAVGTPSYTYLTADHLGTPVMATDAAGVALWDGGFEPFGADYDGASSVGMFLRFPGQWVDDAVAGSAPDASYNLYRWYSSRVGSYLRPDPLSSFTLAPTASPTEPFRYAGSRPSTMIDPLGLCALMPDTERCLMFVFGEPVSRVRITAKPRPNSKWFATTRKNRITPYVTCDEFFSATEAVLEEYYHVLRQWNRGRMSRVSWLMQTLQNGYDGNSFEIEAKQWARDNVADFETCLRCPSDARVPATIGPGGVFPP